jgi:putative addiction module antidote
MARKRQIMRSKSTNTNKPRQTARRTETAKSTSKSGEPKATDRIFAVRNMKTVKLTTVGSSTGLVLPKEILERMRVSKGDLLHVVETPNGVELTPYNPEFAAQIAIAEEVMRTDRDVLRQLAQ